MYSDVRIKSIEIYQRTFSKIATSSRSLFWKSFHRDLSFRKDSDKSEINYCEYVEKNIDVTYKTFGKILRT